MIVYACPKCGNELEHTVICSLPPIDVMTCHKCGYKNEQRQELEKVKYPSANVTKAK